MKSRLRVESTALSPEAFLPGPALLFRGGGIRNAPFQSHQAAYQRQACHDIAAKGGSGPPFRNDVAGQRRTYGAARVEYQGVHAHGLLQLPARDQIAHKSLLRGKTHCLVDAHDQPGGIQVP